MAQILVFGASTTYGSWDTQGGWVQRLRSFIDKKVIESNQEIYHIVYNLGIDGDMSEGVLKRLEREVEVRTWDDEVVMVICIGINDSTVFHETNKPVVSLEEYRANLEKIVRKSQKRSKKIILVGLFPVDESMVNPIPWLEHHSYKNEYIKQYEDVMGQVASFYKAHFIPLFEQFYQGEYKQLLFDGVHPNDQGHEAIYQIVKDYLLKKQVIEL